METIQVVLDSKLLKATDRAVKKAKTNRSALVRDALRDHLKKLAVRELEEQERRAYERLPFDESELMESEAVWPPQ
jgi:metal-responsive CopG/Arc/MetJ family transcriptional regulator